MSAERFQDSPNAAKILDDCVQRGRKILLTDRQAIEATGLSRKTLYLLRQRGELAFVKIGTSIRYRYADIEALAERFLTRAEQPQNPEN